MFLKGLSHSEKRILIVDDEPSLRDSYARLLSGAGFQVAEAESGKEALRQIAREPFDLVITDVRMPQMDGLALLRRLHTQRPKLPVIVMLDTASNQTALRAAELGAVQSLVKPIEQKILSRWAAYALDLAPAQKNHEIEFRDRRGEPRVPLRITATEAKNNLGQVLDRVIQDGAILITKHESPKAALVSMEEFQALSRGRETKLDTLSDEFDSLLARMQTPRARAGMKAAFHASPEQLGKAAVAMARRRG
jgi:antitoxin Phd